MYKCVFDRNVLHLVVEHRKHVASVIVGVSSIIMNIQLGNYCIIVTVSVLGAFLIAMCCTWLLSIVNMFRVS